MDFSHSLKKLTQALEGSPKRGKSTYGRVDSKNGFFVKQGLFVVAEINKVMPLLQSEAPGFRCNASSFRLVFRK